MPAFLLAAPAVLAGFLLYMLLPYRHMLAWFLVPLLFYIFAIIGASKVINMWWYQRYPPKEDPELMRVVKLFFNYFRRLPAQEQVRFEYRLSLFNMEMEYMSKEMPEVPPDLMALMSSTAIQVSFGLEEFMLPGFEKLVLYRQPFHTPAIQKFHTGEINTEDGVIILAGDAFVKGLKKPQQHYNMAIHQFAMATAHQLAWDTAAVLRLEEEVEDPVMTIKVRLAHIRNWSERFEQEYLPVEESELFGLCVEHFFNAADRFSQEWPTAYNALMDLLNQDPRKKQGPVVLPTATTKFMKVVVKKGGG